MAKMRGRLLRQIATRGVIAVLPVAMVTAYASGLFIEPPRLVEAEYQTVAEITTTPNTIGVATSPLYGQTKAEIEKQLDDLLSIGVTTIRVFVPWGLVEPLDNVYNWSHIDDIMSAAAARNMGVMAQVNATPIWGGANGPGFPIGSGAPNVAAFTDFMGVLATRYGPTVSAYEIWNEPNYYQFFNPISPEAYTELLKSVYPVLKALDPTATVVAGAVGATQTFPGLTMSPVEFVQRMLAAGASDFFDALSVHPYGDQIPFSGSCPSCPPGILTPRQQVEAIMGMLAGKKVWITEYGLPTAPGGFTEAQQAAWIKDLLDTWQTYDPALVGPIFLYTIRDALNPQDPASLENFYGLWNALGVEKASVDMLRDWIIAHPQIPGPGNPGTGTPPNPVAQIIAAIQQAVQAVVQTVVSVVRTVVETAVNLVRTVIQAVVNTVTSLVGILQPPAAAVTTLVSDVEVPDAAMRTASLVAEFEAAASKVAVDGEVVEGAVTEGAVTEGAEVVPTEELTPAVELVTEAVEPVVVEPVVVEPVIVEPVLVEPVVVEPVVVDPVVEAPAETPTEVEASPEPAAEASPAPSESTPAESDDDSAAKPSPDSSSDPATKPADSPKPDAAKPDATKPSKKSEDSTPASTKSGSASAAKADDKPAKSTDKGSAKRETVSVTVGAGKSSGTASAGSSGDASSGGSDD
ncbi:cellulase family glycosylhydrolase [Mycolicibacterium sp. YH-1]|uniref:cellulase family glycosylhydrolase n=1 Tax=Mycolicibacterium sp. YH-1 TaxID=2908837 RepID=UPI001F4BEEED|nr:cellulase family glycosylhydrolase [Mycolicibacterium sp. YH-1]UNB55393.1 cellulase family glycosylhydrolase [Mycolicibacterium sp. YH-1]